MDANLLSFDSSGIVGTEEVHKDVFGEKYRPDIMSMVVRWQMAKSRSGTHSTKGISDVRGTTRKPHKQKGTGKARQGSLRSPHFRGGGIIFGPISRDHSFSLNKKFRTLGLKSALSLKFTNGALYFIKDGEHSAPSNASSLMKWLRTHECVSKGPVLIVVEGSVISRASANLRSVDVLPVIGLNVYDILRCRHIIFIGNTKEGLYNRLGSV